MTQVFQLPDVGEGLTEAEVVSWKVKPGDTVGVNDVILEIETAKSLVELPCPYAGTVAELLVAEGDTIAVGAPLVRIGDQESAQTAQSAQPEGAQPQAAQPETAQPGSAATEAAANGAGDSGGDEPSGMLVGYGPRTASVQRRPRKKTPPPAEAKEARDDAGRSEPDPAESVRAKPPVRKLAKDLGVDLRSVTPSGPGDTVTRADVEAHAGYGETQAPSSTTPATGAASGPRETRVPVRGVRKRMAEAMVESAYTAPHVSEWVTLDATGTVELVDQLSKHPDFRELKVSPLLIVAKACLLAARRTPEANATWDGPAQEIVLKHDVNLGIAAATPRGLVVPNIKGADQLSLVELCRALGALTTTARAGKTPPEDMLGTTFTITNVGVFGVDAGTPILNPGESAILAMGAIAKRPWVVDDEIVPRWVTTLTLSFDHRIVDGEQGSRFLADVAAIVRDPGSTLMYV